MKAYGRVEKKLHSFLNLDNVVVSGQLQAPAVFPSGKVSPLAIIQGIVGLAPEPVWMLHTRKTCCSCRVLPLAQPAVHKLLHTIQAQKGHQPTRLLQWTSSNVDGIFREPSDNVLRSNCP